MRSRHPAAFNNDRDIAPAAARAHCAASACLAALQGGQTGAYPIKAKSDQQAPFG